MDIQQWHARYKQQSSWTSAARKYLIQKVPLSNVGRALDVGFGTGAVVDHWPAGFRFYGIDLNYEGLLFAKENSPQIVNLVNGDAFFLPYKEDSFDLVTSHFLLLWIARPADVIGEMVRVCKPSGQIIFFAEPDYGARIDFPRPLEALGSAQRESLKAQGADPEIGRKLLGLASAADLINIEVGIIGYQSGLNQDEAFWENEWEILQYDLAGRLTEAALAELRQVNLSARQTGDRILFVPTFYLYAEVP